MRRKNRTPFGLWLFVAIFFGFVVLVLRSGYPPVYKPVPLEPLDGKPIDTSRWITVLNDEPIKNDDRTYLKGDKCLPQSDHKPKVIRQDRDKITYEYQSPNGKGWGVECPTGTIYEKPVGQ